MKRTLGVTLVAVVAVLVLPSLALAAPTAVTLAASPSPTSAGGAVSLIGTMTPPASDAGTITLETMPGTSTAWTPVFVSVVTTNQSTYNLPGTVAVSTVFRTIVEIRGDIPVMSNTATVAVLPAVTIQAPSRAVVTRSLAISGTVSPCLPGELVTIKAKVAGLTRTLGTPTVAADGSYRFSTTPRTLGSWHLSAAVGTNAIHAAGSATRSVSVYKVKPSLGFACSPTLVRLGALTEGSAAVLPDIFSGRYLYLQRYASGRWVNVRSVRLASSASICRFSFRPASGKNRYRMNFPAQADHFARASAVHHVTAYVPVPRLRASVSDSSPSQFSDVTAYGKVTDQHGKPLSGAHCTFTWHYKSVTHTGSATTGSDGIAADTRHIAGATKGYFVRIDVRATWSSRSMSASTGFTPN